MSGALSSADEVSGKRRAATLVSTADRLGLRDHDVDRLPRPGQSAVGLGPEPVLPGPCPLPARSTSRADARGVLDRAISRAVLRRALRRPAPHRARLRPACLGAWRGATRRFARGPPARPPDKTAGL